MDLDGRGNVYIAGYTNSTDFPTVNALQPGLYPGICGTPPDACSDGFVASLSADGQDLIFSAYLGGSADDIIWDLRVGLSNDVYFVGVTGSLDYPTVSPLQPTYRGGANDSFVSKIAGSHRYSGIAGRRLLLCSSGRRGRFFHVYCINESINHSIGERQRFVFGIRRQASE
jgi:hypothetical protein